jgi:hypothetical protein
VCPGQSGRGIPRFRGVSLLDVSTRYYSETGVPLVTAAQVAAFCRVKVRTVYQWVRRRKLEVVGLGDHGKQLFNSTEVEALCQLAALPW